ncbi:MAG TPA: VOC family protein [Candidatus Lokiarchaeia archaeon]|nr:VOC family protein [Candidatus Lokiarchaeia archaeon]
MERKINQIGIVVKDLQVAVNFYQDVLGIGPFQVIDRPEEICVLHGEESRFQIRTALCLIGGIQLEIVQVLSGRNAYTEFLETKGEGVHHLGIFVDDIETELASAVDKGMEIVSRQEFVGVKSAYIDTFNILGHLVEFIELPKPRSRKSKKE